MAYTLAPLYNTLAPLYFIFAPLHHILAPLYYILVHFALSKKTSPKNGTFCIRLFLYGTYQQLPTFTFDYFSDSSWRR